MSGFYGQLLMSFLQGVFRTHSQNRSPLEYYIGMGWAWMDICCLSPISIRSLATRGCLHPLLGLSLFSNVWEYSSNNAIISRT